MILDRGHPGAIARRGAESLVTLKSLVLWASPPVDVREIAAREFIARFAAHWLSLPRPGGAISPTLASYLDHADPVVQPSVALVDVTADRRLMVRLFATRREAGFGRNVTGTDALSVYPPEIRGRIWTGVRAVVDHPCGLLTSRIVTSASGVSTEYLSLTLPIALPENGPKCVANCIASVGRPPDEPHVARVSSVGPGSWVDIGAGVPKGENM